MTTSSGTNFTGLYGSSTAVIPSTPYGNANVVGLLSAGTDGANTVGNIISSGNITADYYFGDGSYLTGVTSNYGNAEVSAYLASGADSAGIVTSGEVTAANLLTGGSVQATGNITGGNIFTSGYVTASGNIRSSANVSGVYILGNGSQLTGLPATYSNAQVSSYLASGTNTANIITTGNVSGAYILGNGSQLTGLPATYSNAQVATFLANFGSNTIVTTGNITGGNFIGSGAALTSITGANVTGTVANATYATSAGSATTAVTVTGNAQANITSVGTLTSLSVSGNITGGNVNTGIVSASGNITGGNIVTAGKISATGNIDTGGTINAANIVVTASLSLTGNITANTITATSSMVSPLITTTGGAGNITGVNYAIANYFQGDGSGLTNVPISGTTISVSGNITGGNLNTGGLVSATGAIRSGSTISAVGNITGGNITTAGLVSATGAVISGSTISAVGNITGGNLSGTSIAGTLTTAAQTNITSVGTLGSLTVTANISGGNLVTGGVVTATGNINGANLVASANLTSTQQTVVGTANVGTTGNIVISGKNIATDMQWNPDGGNAATGPYGRIVVGTGFGGNISHSAQQNRLVVADSLNRSNTATAVRSFNAEQYVTLTGNVVQNNFRQQALGGYVRVGGGASANTAAYSSLTNGVPFLFASGQFNLDVGNFATYNLGNTTVSHGTINGGALTVGGASTVNNAFGIYNLINNTSATANAYGNIIGYSTAITGGATGSPPSGNVYAFYHPNTTNVYGPTTSATVQAAPQYYAFYNADDHAQIKLGSLRSYNEYRYSTATSGTVNIDKNNAQVQYIAPTGNVTIGSFQNFVTQTVTTYETDNQVDTVTLIVQQGATPYTVTMPTGNAAIKYANAISTVGSTANSVTMISITSYYTGSATGYLVTVSPEFT